jgi:hypothetical protein
MKFCRMILQFLKLYKMLKIRAFVKDLFRKQFWTNQSLLKKFVDKTPNWRWKELLR